MRTILAVGASASMLVAGVVALSRAASQVEGTAMNDSTASAEAYNASSEVFGGLATAAGPGVVWMGVGAVVLVSLGILVASFGGGR